jgi:hypothetical protein
MNAEDTSVVVDAVLKQKTRLEKELKEEPHSPSLPGSIEACDRLIQMIMELSRESVPVN